MKPRKYQYICSQQRWWRTSQLIVSIITLWLTNNYSNKNQSSSWILLPVVQAGTPLLDLPEFFFYSSSSNNISGGKSSNKYYIHDYHHNATIYGEKPDFLYDIPYQNRSRIVEFYFHGCHHCRNYRSHYIDLAIDLTNRTNSSIDFYAISCGSGANFLLCRKYNVTSFPQIYAFSPIYNTRTKINYWQLNTSLALSLFGFNSTITDESSTTNKAGIVPTTKRQQQYNSNLGNKIVYKLPKKLRNRLLASKFVIKSDVPPPTTGRKGDIYHDIHESFDYQLRNEIFTTATKSLDKRSKDTLRNWFELLQLTIPSTWYLQHIIQALLNDFDTVTNNEDAFMAILDQHIRPKNGRNAYWSDSCSHGEVGNGYSCGLWLLFHTMTVGVVLYNDEHRNQGVFIPPTYVAQTLKEYIQVYLRCSDCTYHFMKEYDRCAYNRCTRLQDNNSTFENDIELPIWLLDTHNGVTLRLLDDVAKAKHKVLTDEEVDNKMWPTNCTDCWIHEDDDHKSLDSIKTFHYMKSEYWPDPNEEAMYTLNGTSLTEVPNATFVVLAIVLLVGYCVYYKKLQKDRIRMLKKKSSNGKLPRP